MENGATLAVLEKQTDFYHLLHSKEFKEFVQILKKLMGLAMSLNSPGKIPYDRKRAKPRSKNRNKVCQMIRNSEQGGWKCRECDRRHYNSSANSGNSLIYTCHAGFWDMAVPMFVQGGHIATISSGQVLPSPVSEEGFQALRKKLAWLNVSEKKLRKAYESAPYLPKRKLRYVVRLLEVFAHQLSENLHHIRELEKKQEREEIRKAKEYIQKNYLNSYLCLNDVARYAGISRSHFSYLFKSSTGLSLTRFVQARRMEEARHFLLYTEQTISEICFACGFNSLTHFNRIFRSFEKMSPRKYRQTKSNL